MTAQELLNALRRHWRIPVVAMILAGVAVGAVIATQKAPAPRWVGGAHLSVSSDDVGLPLALRGSIYKQATVAALPDVIADAKRRAGLPPNTYVTVQPSATVNVDHPESNTVDIGVTTRSREVSAAMASALADSFIDYRRRAQIPELERRQQALLAQITAVQARYAQLPAPPEGQPDDPTKPPRDLAASQRIALTKALADLRTNYGTLVSTEISANGGAALTQLDDPVKVTKGKGAFGPLALLVTLGVLVGLGGAALASVFDTSLHSASDAASVLGVPLLGQVPGRPRGRRKGAPAILHGGAERAAFRALAGTLKASGSATRRLLVTSPRRSDDLASVGANLAAGLSQLGLRVVLVGTDPEQQDVFKSLGLQSKVGYGELVEEAAVGELNGRVRRSLHQVHDLPNLWVLGPGAQHGPTRVRSVDRLLTALEQENLGIDVSVVLGRPLLEDADAPILASEVGSVLWALDVENTSREEAEEAARRLDLTQATPVGVALVSGRRV